LNEEAGRLFMDDYEEYSRTARMITKIHALPANTKIKAKAPVDKYSNSSDNENCSNEETKEEVHISTSKFHFNNTNGLDVSMEEEKEPFQSLMNNSNRQKDAVIEEDSENYISKPGLEDFKNPSSDKAVLSGSSLFGGKGAGGAKKVKGKKKKMRRI
jgi:hypothetical protein